MGQKVTTEIAALALGISTDGIRQAVYKGRLKRYGTKRRALFDIDDLIEYAAKYQRHNNISSITDTRKDTTVSETKFKVGDKVVMPGVPIDPVEVLEIGTCEEESECDMGIETFRFKDPQTGEDDWMHTSEFELAGSE